jgi:hypothetical protein
MKILLNISLFLILNSIAFSQTKINYKLQHKILAMFKTDQKWRIEALKLQDGKKSVYDENTIYNNMSIADSLNMIAAKLIVKKYGYPGYNLVGEKGSDSFWAIVQHCDDDIAFQQKVLLLMAKQVKRQNASGEDFALLQDRVLVNTGQKQIYGTQLITDPITHITKTLPMRDSIHVDSLRKSVGLQSLKEYLKLFEQH